MVFKFDYWNVTDGPFRQKERGNKLSPVSATRSMLDAIWSISTLRGEVCLASCDLYEICNSILLDTRRTSRVLSSVAPWLAFHDGRCFGGKLFRFFRISRLDCDLVLCIPNVFLECRITACFWSTWRRIFWGNSDDISRNFRNWSPLCGVNSGIVWWFSE